MTKQDMAKMIDRMIEAYECFGQPQGDAIVTEKSPGGQTTAHLRNGTPVARYEHARNVFAEAARAHSASIEGTSKTPAVFDGKEAVSALDEIANLHEAAIGLGFAIGENHPRAVAAEQSYQDAYALLKSELESLDGAEYPERKKP